MIDLSYGLAQFAHNASGPSKAGFFNDMDVLEVGNGDFDCSTPESIARAKAHMSMWSLMKSPLLLGTDSLASCPDLDLLAEVDAARKAAPSSSVADWLAGITSVAADVLRLPGLGRLRPGTRPGVLHVACELDGLLAGAPRTWLARPRALIR